jgi:drug/metabolite transporter (DMT)-like permease
MVLSWATYYLVSKWAVDYTGSAFLAGFFLRVAAFVFLSLYILIKKEGKQLFRYGKTTISLFIIGLLGYLLDTFANLGFQHSQVGTGTVLLKTDILMANFATAIIFKEKLFPSDWIATLIMLGGVFLVLNIDYKNFSFNWYDIFFILSALSVTVNAFVIKGVQTRKSVDSDTIAYYNNFTVMILFLISALVAGDFGVLNSINTGGSFILLVLMGGLAQSLIYIFYYRNLKRFPVWEVKLFLLLIPIVSCIVGVIAFGERIVSLQIVGAALVLIGASVILLRNKINVKTA